ncbi:glycerol-3-phosphate dehydrogenase (NAD+) [Wolbachia endosymbiont of Armadillidium vulgare str. wVulC]|uniref:Glycerol-3-phosphate dehydrogenase [NAD(P)+] n=1 Tax=Wolbachia endosymbiont of Armadillidium arcangelii TaxID=3158571 RepID=A0AAU7Q2N3_9RICK|nr:NAD(P)H-dependent glycerol-3-phosphate dehydrogenase [Wolbachia endosymbiont of Armadillidium vulgare]KLT23190.1 glycerol-3-phosphate dehydrogenase (NAD+) [Wolbachia endosymbiont of Armadillidium vulgare str. wVulC]OJH30526.1 Glycerol-3-phosphate dehydrogenase [NAD(P)+] [Armadillidium vulgare] [Wolbachia endosymbiont of Armadillidium vulgare]OJH30777.1 Glycerol-3-phosphate dehydrogenase [NAD(P)+] [Wolbachia endosymbiont of Armadillidium vulgare]OJH31888.1 Glycerol-3-phosphate dehydrogenase [
MAISILGAGAWGTAIAISLSSKKNVILWTRNEATFESIKEKRESDKLPGYPISDNVSVKLAIEDTVNASVIILAVPTQSLREICHQLHDCNLKKNAAVILACKGIEKSTLKLPSEIVNEVLPNNPIAVFSGPSFAIEVARELPYSMVLACQNDVLCPKLVSELQQENVKLYLSSDVIGIQVCAALKNVFAIACGIVLGSKLGFNAHAALITKSMSEIKNLYSAKVGDHNIDMNTLLGPACLGDLVMTCTSLNSRNLSFGFKVGSNNNSFDVQQILSEGKSVIEGFNTAKSAFDLAGKLKIKMPVCEAIYRLLYENTSIKDTISVLVT